MPTDYHGRPWAKLSELKEGSLIELDAGFTCAKAGVQLVLQDQQGLYFICKNGKHYLDDERLIGIYNART
jgi:hypothetical protein